MFRHGHQENVTHNFLSSLFLISKSKTQVPKVILINSADDVQQLFLSKGLRAYHLLQTSFGGKKAWSYQHVGRQSWPPSLQLLGQRPQPELRATAWRTPQTHYTPPVDESDAGQGKTPGRN